MSISRDLLPADLPDRFQLVLYRAEVDRVMAIRRTFFKQCSHSEALAYLGQAPDTGPKGADWTNDWACETREAIGRYANKQSTSYWSLGGRNTTTSTRLYLLDRQDTFETLEEARLAAIDMAKRAAYAAHEEANAKDAIVAMLQNPSKFGNKE